MDRDEFGRFIVSKGSQKLGDSPRVFFKNSVVANRHGYWIRRKNQGLELEQKRLSRCGTAMHVSSVSS